MSVVVNKDRLADWIRGLPVNILHLYFDLRIVQLPQVVWLDAWVKQLYLVIFARRWRVAFTFWRSLNHAELVVAKAFILTSEEAWA